MSPFPFLQGVGGLGHRSAASMFRPRRFSFGLRFRRAATSLLLNGTGFGSGIFLVPSHRLDPAGGSIFQLGTIGRIAMMYPNPNQLGHFLLTSRISRDWLPGKGHPCFNGLASRRAWLHDAPCLGSDRKFERTTFRDV